MTAYKDFVKDFPNRCHQIFDLAQKGSNLEVTVSLVIACAGFVIPFERLRPPGQIPHPSNDRENHPEASKNLLKLLNSKFIISDLNPNKDNWHAGNLASISGDPDSWSEIDRPKQVTKDKTVGNILKCIRNALAHGNLYTKGDPIESIIFISSNMDSQNKTVKNYSYVCVSPSEFSKFLRNWFNFLAKNEVSNSNLKELLDNAA